MLRHTGFESQHQQKKLLQNRRVTYNHNTYIKTKIHFTAVYYSNYCEMYIYVITTIYINRGENFNIYFQDRTKSSLSK